jgi:hypothetical protein
MAARPNTVAITKQCIKVVRPPIRVAIRWYIAFEVAKQRIKVFIQPHIGVAGQLVIIQ